MSNLMLNTTSHATLLPNPVPIGEQRWEEGVVPVLNISCTVYNHAPYIRNALDGFLMQKTAFPVEILIHDDASTDHTADIIREYEKEHPALFKCFYQPENTHSRPDKFELRKPFWDARRAKYIALCEGDDYWTDPLKLQKQVDFLEAHPEYVLCFHKVKVLLPDGGLVDDFITKIPENYQTIYDLARHGNYIHTPSVVFRKVIAAYPDEFRRSPIGDFPLYILLSRHGRLHYLPECMAVYRHGVGMWSRQDSYYRRLNTALAHNALLGYVSRVGDDELVGIFAGRIVDFMDQYQERLSDADLDSLCAHPLVGKMLVRRLLAKNERLKPLLIQNISSKQLVRILWRRVRSKLWS